MADYIVLAVQFPPGTKPGAARTAMKRLGFVPKKDAEGKRIPANLILPRAGRKADDTLEFNLQGDSQYVRNTKSEVMVGNIKVIFAQAVGK